jgi:hypothetical protein
MLKILRLHKTGPSKFSMYTPKIKNWSPRHQTLTPLRNKGNCLGYNSNKGDFRKIPDRSKNLEVQRSFLALESRCIPIFIIQVSIMMQT